MVLRSGATIELVKLLCVTSKVLERLVFNHVIGYLTKHLSNQQFGLMTDRSSLQQLLLFINNILEARTQLSNADVIYVPIDFRKAFDLVPHNELLYKLWKYGLTGIFGCGLGTTCPPEHNVLK